ncbi:MAG TPA: hypothetical protein VIR57_15090 [Chloroflexota bacterium]
MKPAVSLDYVVKLARQLSPVEKVRLIEQVAPDIERELEPKAKVPRRSQFGALKDLGPAPSFEEIEEARREAWANFPREFPGEDE